MTIKKPNYNVLTGVWKTIQNAAIFLLPSLVAYQVNTPQKWAGIVAVAIYFIKNYIKNK